MEQLKSDPPPVQAGTIKDWEFATLNGNRYSNLLIRKETTVIVVIFFIAPAVRAGLAT